MKKKIIFWAHSYCRSTLQFYSEIAKNIGLPCIIYTWIHNLDLRAEVGFSDREFDSLEIIPVGDDWKKSFELLATHLEDYHIFCAYQTSSLHRALIKELIKKRIRYGIISEAPCNMEKYPMHLLKSLYFNAILPIRLHNVIRNADFILNCSGYYEDALERIGWIPSQIISCGYYPPRVPGSHERLRNESNWEKFTILLTGLHQWHRSPWLLIRALVILKKRGMTPKCFITQNGPYLEYLKKLVNRFGLNNVEFLGFVEMRELIQLYENCSVYVGTGNYEPWGMRLNDVLACGAPLIVNRGMGGCKMIDDFKCGLTFKRNDVDGLANCLERMIKDKNFYLNMCQNAFDAVNAINPASAAMRYGGQIKKFIVK